jgi:hypothetical protein
MVSQPCQWVPAKPLSDRGVLDADLACCRLQAGIVAKEMEDFLDMFGLVMSGTMKEHPDFFAFLNDWQGRDSRARAGGGLAAGRAQVNARSGDEHQDE